MSTMTTTPAPSHEFARTDDHPDVKAGSDTLAGLREHEAALEAQLRETPTAKAAIEAGAAALLDGKKPNSPVDVAKLRHDLAVAREAISKAEAQLTSAVRDAQEQVRRDAMPTMVAILDGAAEAIEHHLAPLGDEMEALMRAVRDAGAPDTGRPWKHHHNTLIDLAKRSERWRTEYVQDTMKEAV